MNMAELNYQCFTNKEIRLTMYREASQFINGYLGKGRRVKLPICVTGEIMDFAPEPGQKYVGFQEGTFIVKDEE